jgi:RNA polymerase sigma-70 factor, ECF subfamily
MESWEEIVNEHGPPAFQSAWRILRHSQDCEDDMQEVFIEAHRAYSKSKVKYWRAFLVRLATCRALDALRRRRSFSEHEPTLLPSRSTSPEENAMAEEAEMQIRALVTGLATRQAAVFCLAHFEELSHDEIAQTLEISSKQTTKDVVSDSGAMAVSLRQDKNTRIEMPDGRLSITSLKGGKRLEINPEEKTAFGIGAPGQIPPT